MFEFQKRSMRNHSNAKSSPFPGRPMAQPVPLLHPQASQATGNQTAQAFSRSCPIGLPTPDRCPFGGVCHTCPMRPQTKLKISQPGDKYEQEADRVAEQVIDMQSSNNYENVAIHRMYESFEAARACIGDNGGRRGQNLNKEDRLEVRTTRKCKDHDLLADLDLPTQMNTMESRGRPLPEAVRTFFERRFGYDFSQVRIHTDAQADEITHQLKAQAFSDGKNIVFAHSKCDPHSTKGTRIIAHEIAHIIQQNQHNIKMIMRTCDCEEGQQPTADVRNYLSSVFPGLRQGEYCILEASNPSYNCYGYSVGRPEFLDDGYINHEYGHILGGDLTFGALDLFYAAHGLYRTNIINPEVIVYADGNLPQHAARRSPYTCNNRVMYASKLGREQLILHLPEQLESSGYGRITRFYDRFQLRRPLYPERAPSRLQYGRPEDW